MSYAVPLVPPTSRSGTSHYKRRSLDNARQMSLSLSLSPSTLLYFWGSPNAPVRVAARARPPRRRAKVGQLVRRTFANVARLMDDLMNGGWSGRPVLPPFLPVIHSTDGGEILLVNIGCCRGMLIFPTIFDPSSRHGIQSIYLHEELEGRLR